MLEITIDTRQAARDLELLARRVDRPLRPEMLRIDDLLRRSLDRNFLALGRPQRWKPVKRASIRRRKRNIGGDRAILRDTDTLRRSVVGPRGGKGQINRVTGSEVVRGTEVPYALFHQEGATRLPRREFLRLQSEDLTAIEEVIGRAMTARVEGRQ